MILCLAGNPSIDKLFEVERVTPGEIHRPLGFIQVPGGKGLNVARAVARLGGEVMASGLLAGHAGRWVEENLPHEGVQARFAWTEGETRSSLSVADRETGSLTEFYENGSEIGETAWRGLEELVQGLLVQADWLALSGSLPPGAPVDIYRRLAEAGRRSGVSVAVDSRGEALAAALHARPELVKINLEEAIELIERPVRGIGEAVAAAQEIRERLGGKGHAAVITLGVEGTVLVAPDGGAWLGRPTRHGLYPVGCGDVFLGAMLTALAAGSKWADALRLAVGASAANAQAPGAGRFEAELAAELAASAEISMLPG